MVDHCLGEVQKRKQMAVSSLITMARWVHDGYDALSWALLPINSRTFHIFRSPRSTRTERQTSHTTTLFVFDSIEVGLKPLRFMASQYGSMTSRTRSYCQTQSFAIGKCICACRSGQRSWWEPMLRSLL